MVNITPALMARREDEKKAKEAAEEKKARAEKRKAIEERVRNSHLYQKPFKDQRLIALREALK